MTRLELRRSTSCGRPTDWIRPGAPSALCRVVGLGWILSAQAVWGQTAQEAQVAQTQVAQSQDVQAQGAPEIADADPADAGPAVESERVDTGPLDIGSPDTSGFIYGVVETRSRTYEGRLRWGKRDAFWGDFLQASKEKRPYLKTIPVQERMVTDRIEVMGKTFEKRRLAHKRRGFMARFGDVARIEAHGRSWSTVVFRDGTELDVSGGRDFRSDVIIYGADGSETELDWRRVLRIRFMATPDDLAVASYRVYGTVKTTAGDWVGYVQWDREECTSEDVIDGYGQEPGRELDFALGEIRSIEKVDDESSRLMLVGGEEVVMHGTNDVDQDNRGIWVEVPEWGRIAVPWDAFIRLDFSPPPGSGPSYEDFAPPSPLAGTVSTTDGSAHRGRLIYDVDEAADWELLNGDSEDLSYEIPFALVRSIERLSETTSRVTTKSGRTVELSGGTDVGDGHSGVIVLSSAGDSQYLPWRDIRQIDFDDPVR